MNEREKVRKAILRLHAKGLTVAEIGPRVGKAFAAVKLILQREGLTPLLRREATVEQKALLALAGGPLSTREIAEATGCAPGTLRTCLRTMERHGKVMSSKDSPRPGGGYPILRWRLP